MKKNIFIFCLLLLFCFSFSNQINYVKADSISLDEDNNDLKPTIKYSQILYNIDDNGDYLYIEYIDYGYVIYIIP